MLKIQYGRKVNPDDQTAFTFFHVLLCLCLCVCVIGGDGHQSNGVLSAQQSGQLLQPAHRQQRARRGRK